MEEMDIMFNNLSIAYSKMDVDEEVKNINSNYLIEMNSNIQDIKQNINNDMKTLHIIAEKGYYDICKNYIIGNRVNIRTNITRRIPLHYACMNDNINIAELLLNNGSEINTQDIYRYYPIDYATIRNNKEMIKLLICCGSIVETSFNYAVHNGYYDIVEELLKTNLDSIFLEEALDSANNNNNIILSNLITNYITNL